MEIADSGRVLEATGRLLTSPDWRQRAIEKVVPLSADHYELRRSFQFEIPPDLVADLAHHDRVDVLLPVSWLPKQALLDFDITDETGQPLVVLERRSIAGALSQILHAWSTQISMPADTFGAQLLESVCFASLAPWRAAQGEAHRRATETEVLCQYLNALMPFRVTPDDVDGSLMEGRQLARAGYELLEMDFTDSHLDNTLMVAAVLAPYIVPLVDNAERLRRVIAAHAERAEALIEAARTFDEVQGWLATALRAGVEWPLLVRANPPVGAPFLVKVREVRQSGPADPRIFAHRADLTVARSYHFHARSPDANVRMKRLPVVTRADGQTLGPLDLFENSGLTDELFTMHTSLDDRPDWVDVTLKFDLRPSALLGHIFTLLLVAGATVVALAEQVSDERAGVLTIPTTFATAFLLFRDPPLVARFMRVWRAAVLLSTAMLWIVVLWKLTGCPAEPISLVGC